ncbi:hypothetical protein LCGC14_1510320 [marine sediment metagenome]|uniref:Glycosyltransferase family 1 protein n=1 Tax=marine sediment metagenome TaxID=412755 RepID=A0A0F9J1N0_9ZZZZ
MKVLFTARGGSTGTWRMRGVEMASAKPDWRVIANANKHDLKGMDAVVLIKRLPPHTLNEIRKWGGPFFYDALDFWRQPIDDVYVSSVQDIQKRFKDRLRQCSPHIVLCTNKIMAKDIASMGYKTKVHYHHYDPRLVPYENAVPNSILYWGRKQYLGEWYDIMSERCKKLNKTFLCHSGKESIIGNSALCTEAMFAVRGGDYGTWLARRWKSGIKGITAERLGVPFIAMREQSYMEQSTKNLFAFEDEDELEGAIIRAFEEKDKSYIRNPSTKYSLENCANQLEKTIEEAMFYV